MRKAAKDRLLIMGVVVATLLFVLCFVPSAHRTLEASLNLRPWAHMTLEASLNLLWVLLAFGAFVHWVAPGASRGRDRVPGLVTLVFVLSLLFPVISANDDLLRQDLLNDAKTSQSIVSKFKSEKQLRGLVGLFGLPEALAVQSAPVRRADAGFVSEPAQVASVATPGDATGNHSPPLC